MPHLFRNSLVALALSAALLLGLTRVLAPLDAATPPIATAEPSNAQLAYKVALTLVTLAIDRAFAATAPTPPRSQPAATAAAPSQPLRRLHMPYYSFATAHPNRAKES